MTDQDSQPRCFFCNQPGAVVCNSPECQAWEREIREEQAALAAEDLDKAVWAAIRQRCSHEDNWKLNAFDRLFYTIKVLICVAMQRQRNYLTTPGYPDRITVAVHHYAKLYAGWEMRQIVVGKGIFSQWWYEIEADGDWYL